jgi:hypothetical protein
MSDTFPAPVGAQLDARERHGEEDAKLKLPNTRRGGCSEMLGFDCGSASKGDAGPVGKLAKWVRSM